MPEISINDENDSLTSQEKQTIRELDHFFLHYSCPASKRFLEHVQRSSDESDIDYTLLNDMQNIDYQDKNGHSALITACQKGYINLVEILLDAGANPQLKDRMHGFTAYDFANECYHDDIVQLFKERGLAQFSKEKDPAESFVDLARNGHIDIAIRHFENPQHHININHKDSEGKTAATYSVINNDLEFLHYLQEQGAHLSIADKTKRTPLVYALENKQTDIANYLVTHGSSIGEFLDKVKTVDTQLLDSLYQDGQFQCADLLIAEALNRDALVLASTSSHFFERTKKSLLKTPHFNNEEDIEDFITLNQSKLLLDGIILQSNGSTKTDRKEIENALIDVVTQSPQFEKQNLIIETLTQITNERLVRINDRPKFLTAALDLKDHHAYFICEFGEGNVPEKLSLCNGNNKSVLKPFLGNKTQEQYPGVLSFTPDLDKIEECYPTYHTWLHDFADEFKGMTHHDLHRKDADVLIESLVSICQLTQNHGLRIKDTQIFCDDQTKPNNPLKATNIALRYALKLKDPSLVFDDPDMKKASGNGHDIYKGYEKAVTEQALYNLLRIIHIRGTEDLFHQKAKNIIDNVTSRQRQEDSEKEVQEGEENRKPNASAQHTATDKLLSNLRNQTTL